MASRLAFAGLLLTSCVFAASCVTVRTDRELDCSKPAGVPLSQFQPFRVCGELMDIVEGEGATVIFSPLASLSVYTTACFELNISRVSFAIDWCSKLVMPMLMLNRYIQHVNFSVDRDPNAYMFVGCSDVYRTKFQITRNASSYPKADCLTVLSYAKDSNVPPLTKFSKRGMLTGNQMNIFATPEKVRSDQESVGRKRLPCHWVTMLLAALCLLLDYN